MSYIDFALSAQCKGSALLYNCTQCPVPHYTVALSAQCIASASPNRGTPVLSATFVLGTRIVTRHAPVANPLTHPCLCPRPHNLSVRVPRPASKTPTREQKLPRVRSDTRRFRSTLVPAEVVHFP